MNIRRYAVLDRDGTIIVERPYLSDPDAVQLIPGAGAALREMAKLGLGLVVATNQSGIGRGFFDEARLGVIHQRMQELLEGEGVGLDKIYYCPHKPQDECNCRKPKPGLLMRAAEDFHFDPKTAFVIGDNVCDIDLGRGQGSTTILVRTGYGRQVAEQGKVQPDYVVDDLEEAASCLRRVLSA
jgi:D-glycero-D-manno-heptose 1,7-bisphosphate phosphatase